MSADGLSALTTIDGSSLVLHTKGGERRYLAGINLGATVPGQSPGQVDLVEAEHYRRWLAIAGDIGFRVVRVYTLHPPAFYDELAAYNQAHPDAPMYLAQGVYFTDEAAFATSGDLWQPDVRDSFLAEIEDVHDAVRGHLQRGPTPGRASGTWHTDVTPWLAMWIAGIELDPNATAASDRTNAQRPPFEGRYFANAPGSTPTERWLAEALDHLASLEAGTGRSPAIAFTNWPTLDPIRHPAEPLESEDLVQLDANHVLPTSAWPGGSFASYHSYPYYPDFLRHEPRLQVPDDDGTVDPYRAYVRSLRSHHGEAGLPVLITETGVPSSPGTAHLGPRGRGQGAHTEAEAAQIDAELLRVVHEEGLSGAFLFELLDEWFKFTWNTIDFQIPPARRSLWHDELTNEQHFGMVAVDSHLAPELRLGDPPEEWVASTRVIHESSDGLREVRVAQDEAFVYLRLRFDDVPDNFVLGLDVLPSAGAGGLPGHPDVGPDSDVAIQIQIAEGRRAGRVLGWAGSDATHLLYGAVRGWTTFDPAETQPGSNVWVPRRMIVNHPLVVPTTGERLDPEFVDVSELRWGQTVPGQEEYDAHANLWVDDGEVQLRLPWALIGFADPSSLQALRVDDDGTIRAVPTPGIGLTVASGGEAVSVRFSWPPWQRARGVERLKDGIAIVSAAVVELSTPEGG